MDDLRTYCTVAVELGVSANVALKLWVASGRPIRRQRFYNTWRVAMAASAAATRSRAAA